MHTLAVIAFSIGFFEVVNCQCDGSALEISSGQGEIQSPNYPREYGQSANCTWNFIRPRDVNHVLEIDVTTMNLYFEDEARRRYCPGSYDLTIAGELVDCTVHIDGESDIDVCVTFNSSCTNHTSPCDKVRSISSDVEVTYESDGRMDGEQIIWGFRIAYKYITCGTATTDPTSTAPEETTSTASSVNDGETTSSTGKSQDVITSRGSTSTVTTSPASQTATDFSSVSDSPADRPTTTPSPEDTTSSHSSPSATNGETSLATESNRELALAIGLGVAAGIFILGATAFVGYYFWRRKRAAGNEQSVAFRTTEDTPDDRYENDTVCSKPDKAVMQPSNHTHSYVNDPVAENIYEQVSPVNGYEGSGYDDNIQL